MDTSFFSESEKEKPALVFDRCDQPPTATAHNSEKTCMHNNIIILSKYYCRTGIKDSFISGT